VSRVRLSDLLRLTRAPFAPTAAWDVLAATALALAAADLPLATLPVASWALLALTVLLVYAAGMAANDLADRQADRSKAPDRPIPAGRVSVVQATMLVLLLASGALLLGGGPAGSRPAVAAAVLLAALYDFGAKRSVVAGAAAMGLVRAASAAVGVLPLVVAHVTPAWALLGPLAIGLYAAAITLWSTTEDEAGPGRRIVARVLVLAAFALAGALAWIAAGHATLGIVLALGVVSTVAFARRPLPGPAKRQVREMLLGLYYLSAALASAADEGSLAANGIALGVAVGLIYVTQIAMRALARALRTG